MFALNSLTESLYSIGLSLIFFSDLFRVSWLSSLHYEIRGLVKSYISDATARREDFLKKLLPYLNEPLP